MVLVICVEDTLLVIDIFVFSYPLSFVYVFWIFKKTLILFLHLMIYMIKRDCVQRFDWLCLLFFTTYSLLFKKLNQMLAVCRQLWLKLAGLAGSVHLSHLMACGIWVRTESHVDSLTQSLLHITVIFFSSVPAYV